MEPTQILLIFQDGNISIERSLLESYPDSVMGSYLLENPDIHTLDVMVFSHLQMNLKKFMRIHKLLKKEISLSEMTFDDIKILDFLGFSIPNVVYLQQYLRNKMDVIYDQYDSLMNDENNFLQIDDDNFTMHYDICTPMSSLYLLRLRKFTINFLPDKSLTFILVETNINPHNTCSICIGFICLDTSICKKLTWDFDGSNDMIKIMHDTITNISDFVHQQFEIQYVKKTNFPVIGLEECLFEITNMGSCLATKKCFLYPAPMNKFIADIQYAKKFINRQISNDLVNQILNFILKINSDIKFEQISKFIYKKNIVIKI
jgi:hypothetical protein